MQKPPLAAITGIRRTMLQRFWHEEEGQTLVEYGLLISLIALVVIAVLTVMGRKVSNTFNAASEKLTTETG
jgi:pilus assembly protein Flp/PilA